MANPYFQFKQFTVYQDQCAMKVSTDACVFGAWMAAVVARFGVSADVRGHVDVDAGAAMRILDIGTGTGLLSLMIAQQSPADITGVEIEPQAAAQAASNIAASPWASRLRVVLADINDVALPPSAFDVIITNPPFFSGDLRSEAVGRNLARHGDKLSLSELIRIFDQRLTPEGVAGILLPYHRVSPFLEEAAEAGFYCREKVLLRQTPAHDYFRGMLLLGRGSGTAIEREWVIKDRDQYTSVFVELLKDYYLYL